MKRVVTGALVVTGDGESILEGVDVLIVGGRVERIAANLAGPGIEVIDARGSVVMPGLVNLHVHGVSPGPLMPSGGRPLPRWKWMENLDRHLTQGTTAVLNLCGLSTMDSVNVANDAHPVRVGGATTHEPMAVSAALAADGAGLTEDVLKTTVAEQIALGAVAIGELGGGQTLAGGGQDVVYLPAAFLDRYQVRVEPWQARLLKEAVLGRSLEWLAEGAVALAEERVDAALMDAGLKGELQAAAVVDTVRAVVLPSLTPALAGIEEGIRLAGVHGVPAFVHSAAVTGGLLTSLAQSSTGARIVASHVNHPSYLPDEAIELARLGRAAGWANEACVFDLVHQREMVTSREHWDAVFDAGDLIDVIATDYGPGGKHDSLLHAVKDLVDGNRRSLAQAVRLVTSAPAELVPGLTPAAGRLTPGGIADLVIAERGDISVVRDVLVDGMTVVRNGVVDYHTAPVLSCDEFARLESVVGADIALGDEDAIAASHRELQARVSDLRNWMSR
ncbi:amidohydrolase family protein [Pseudarthrobacter sp. SSS035]|uniref:amidohydrolase family protein n=1 Tax=Pseudarthrobacter sp. SSS035 TaxID=2931399 RepID=UPI00200CC5D5|nr:amidohydrolase family protein [Pseudarthrobacter sp. SSS035]